MSSVFHHGPGQDAPPPPLAPSQGAHIFSVPLAPLRAPVWCAQQTQDPPLPLTRHGARCGGKVHD